MRPVKIGDKVIGEDHPVFIVAEAGINHNGRLEQAKDLVKMAKEVGADAIKFQAFKTESLCSRSSDYFKLFKSLELTRGDWAKVAQVAQDVRITFFCSAFDEGSVDLLDYLGVPAFKIASGDITYLALLGYVARKNKPIILSTGMSTLAEVDEALNTIYSTGNRDVILLHCVSDYPANADDVNLSAINTLELAFRIPTGFSDHTVGTVIPVAAVCLGAKVIEKHFTLDRNLAGPDHALSLDPSGFREMVRNIRTVEQAFGDGAKAPRACETAAIQSARRSVIAKKDIPAGARIT